MNAPPSSSRRDYLLLAGKIISLLMQAFMAIGAVALVTGIAAALFYRDQLIADYASEVGDPTAVFPTMALLGVMLIGLAIVCALFVFFGKLRQIIATVGEGDPFDPANADRLSLMGWVMLGVQLLVLPAGALGAQLMQFADELDDVEISGGVNVDLSGILIVILLFILARVFRHGAAMRDDLEGTV